jgi:hypothetical protein
MKSRGRTIKKNSRCSFKRIGGKCDCGVWGHKSIHIRYPYKDDERFTQRARKWIKKQGIEIVKKFRDMFE